MSAAARDAPRLPFEQSARAALEDATMRANVLRATTTIRARRAAAVAETPDWPSSGQRARPSASGRCCVSTSSSCGSRRR